MRRFLLDLSPLRVSRGFRNLVIGDAISIIGTQITAVAVPLHRGRSTQVWSVEITDEEGRLVCVSRCTLAVVPIEVGT